MDKHTLTNKIHAFCTDRHNIVNNPPYQHIAILWFSLACLHCSYNERFNHYRKRHVTRICRKFHVMYGNSGTYGNSGAFPKTIRTKDFVRGRMLASYPRWGGIHYCVPP